VALDGLSLRIEPGEVYCLLGPNGAGKTTTINLFLHFVEPTSGKALINGKDVAEAPIETKKWVAYIPEQVMLYRNLTGVENLAYFAALAGLGGYRDEELRAYLAMAGLPDEAADRRVGGYSKGMRQKVGIAIALAKKARALLLDEPTSGLDPEASYEFSNLIRMLSEGGVAVLMATHDLFRARDIAHRVGIMRSGRLVREIRGADILQTDLEQVYLDHIRPAASAA
jgi:ABC-2 type transport system ATP-binding protein